MRSAVLIAVVLLVHSAQAQERQKTQPTELFIRGASLPIADVLRSDLGSTQEINQDELEQVPSQSFDDALRHLSPGFSLFRRSSSFAAHPTTQGVSLRGVGPSGASRTLVLLDGLPMNDPFGGWVQWQRLPRNSVEHVRVQENWGSHHFAALGLHSVVELKTTAAFPDSQELSVLAGSQDTARVNVFASGTQTPRWRYALGGEYMRSDGYPIVAVEDRGAIDIAAASNHRLSYGKLQYDLSNDAHTQLLWNIFNEHRGNGTPLTRNNSRAASVALAAQRSYGIGEIRGSIHSSSSGFASTFSSQDPSRQSESPASEQYDVPAQELGIDADWSMQINADTAIEIGADALWREGETRERFRFTENVFQRDRRAGADQVVAGLYGLYRRQLGALRFDGFLRADAWQHSDLFRRETSLTTGQIEKDQSESGAVFLNLNPRLQLSLALDEQSTLRTAITRGYRVPTINELVRPFRVRNDITEANNDLQEEKVLGYDLEYQKLADSYELSLIAFGNLIEDAILNVTQGRGPGNIQPCGFVPDGGLCRQRNNLPQAWSAGIETNLSYRIAPPLKLGAAYLLTLSEISDAGQTEELDGKELAQLPRHQGTLHAELSAEEMELAVFARFVGAQYEDDLNSAKLDEFITLDVVFRYTIASELEFFATAENVLGGHYDVAETAGGVTTIGPPLMLFVGLRLRS